MAWIEFNPNPAGKRVGDCTVRALCKATGKEWADCYAEMTLQGLTMCDMPSANNVWGAYLRRKGFARRILPNACPDCYTLNDFCKEHPEGVFVVGTGSHVVTVIDGDYHDSWDSGNECPVYYFEKAEE